MASTGNVIEASPSRDSETEKTAEKGDNVSVATKDEIDHIKREGNAPAQKSSTSIETKASTAAAAASTTPSASASASTATSRTSQTRRLLTGKTIFVTGLAPRISKLHIEKLMQKFGTAVRIDLKDGNGGNSSSRFCFVEFSNQEEAQNAMGNLHGRMLSGFRLVVQPAHDRSQSVNNQFHSSGSASSSSSGMSVHKEKRMIDKKIEELRKKIKESQR